MDLSLERWRGLSQDNRESLAKQLARNLPTGFEFQSIQRFQLGASENHVALYRFGDATFALIPGGSVVLGFDAERRWEPTPDELESWQGTAEEYGIEKSIHEYVAEVTLRPRQVDIAPFLIETTASEMGWQPLGVDDAEVQEIIRRRGREGQAEFCTGGVSTRVRWADDGSVSAERSLDQTHTDLAAQLRAADFRFPTSDEWEYVCGCGNPSLFRWGDHVPCDRYPIDVSPEEAAWRRQWVLSGGKLERPPGGFASDWDLHRRPNAFGVLIASDPYKYELVAEIGTTRGGDGGSMICGGAGFFVGWLTLATAYFEDHACKHDPVDPISPGFTIGRRVLELR
jgi:hypothetical protein